MVRDEFGQRSSGGGRIGWSGRLVVAVLAVALLSGACETVQVKLHGSENHFGWGVGILF